MWLFLIPYIYLFLWVQTVSQLSGFCFFYIYVCLLYAISLGLGVLLPSPFLCGLLMLGPAQSKSLLNASYCMPGISGLHSFALSSYVLMVLSFASLPA